jgi:hypothetical protein
LRRVKNGILTRFESRFELGLLHHHWLKIILLGKEDHAQLEQEDPEQPSWAGKLHQQ